MTRLALHLLVRGVKNEAGRIVVERQCRRGSRLGLRKGCPPQSQHNRDGDEKNNDKSAQTGQGILIRVC